MFEWTLFLITGVMASIPIATCATPGQAPVQADMSYYYSGSRRVPVRIARDRAAIRLHSGTPSAALRDLMQGNARLRTTTIEELEELEEFPDQRIHILPLQAMVSRDDWDATLTSLRADAMVDMVGTVVLVEATGAPLVMTDRIVVRFNDDVSAETIGRVYQEHDVELVRASEQRTGRVVLRVRPGSGRNALEVANAIYETGLVRYAQPDFIAKTERR